MLLILETKPADIQTVLPENEELTCNPIVTTNSAEEHCLSDMPLQTEGSNAGMFYIQPRAAVSSISSEPSTSNPNSSMEGTIISNPCYDLGNIFLSSFSTKDSLQVVKYLSSDEKYSYLYNHVLPPSTLPSTLLHGKNRRFNTSWIEQYPWVLYSPKLDAIMCGPCSILLTTDKREDKGFLVNKPFNNWEKLNSTLSNHSQLKYHLDSVLAADTLRSTVLNP